MSGIYSYTVELPKSTIPLADYKDKTLLFVNVASKCGLTPQYKDLQALHEKYGDKGLVTIGFPCNQPSSSKIEAHTLLQFKAQEPGTDDEVLQFCQLNYGVTFPIAKKADVNGPDAQPLWKHLKEHAETPVQDIDWGSPYFSPERYGRCCNGVRGICPAASRGFVTIVRRFVDPPPIVRRWFGSMSLRRAVLTALKLLQILGQGRQDPVVPREDYQGQRRRGGARAVTRLFSWHRDVLQVEPSWGVNRNSRRRERRFVRVHIDA
ncbi:hypothetical protein EHS25_009925 [Saitozyma podzolica]|uniref:Glutathione peroxidase n=1 Tax=Saitozyma podzolica TaxID=1890683 RepID=A0A427YI49_9TREE|nr:hypothetical protein EHS25_009925 [Saitozyma podzolica]